MHGLINKLSISDLVDSGTVAKVCCKDCSPTHEDFGEKKHYAVRNFNSVNCNMNQLLTRCLLLHMQLLVT